MRRYRGSSDESTEPTIPYYRFRVPGGEYVLRRESHWHLTFNGIQIGGAYEHSQDAIAAVSRRRNATVPGPNLDGIPDPPEYLGEWQAHPWAVRG